MKTTALGSLVILTLLAGCGDDSPEIVYRLSGQGVTGITISYTDKTGATVDEQSPRLPWEKKITLDDADFEVRLSASCAGGDLNLNTQSSTTADSTSESATKCSLASGEIRVNGKRMDYDNSDTILGVQSVWLNVECGWAGCSTL